jgi:hypothetical protein
MMDGIQLDVTNTHHAQVFHIAKKAIGKTGQGHNVKGNLAL